MVLEVGKVTAQNGKKVKLVVFDVEGVLIPKNRFISKVGEGLGFPKWLKILSIGFLYQIGVFRLKSGLQRVFRVMRGVKTDQLLRALEKVPLMPDVKAVFASLRIQGCKTALISSGLPLFIVQKIASTLLADYAFGVEVGLNNDALTGEIWGDVIEPGGKLRVMSKIMDDEGLSPSDCAVVADDRNNACIFLPEAQKIGYNPDFLIRSKADKVATGKLSQILPAIEGRPMQRASLSSNDILREMIHASGFFVPLLCLFIGAPTIALLIAVMIGLYAASELLRISGTNLPVIPTITRHAASQTELYDFVTSPVYFAVGILFTLILFKAPLNYAAIACFALGDSMASIFGGLASNRPLPYNKSKTLVGSLAGFFFAFLAAMVFVSPFLALVGAAVAMTVESLPLPLNDNIMIPLCTALALTLLI
jgi:phosphoserine phosphatase